MSGEFNDAELAAMESGVTSKGIFFRLATDPPVRLWLGAGQIRPGVNAFDADGAEYLGCGEVQPDGFPIIKQLLNGAAERVSFVMSGVKGKVLQLASIDPDQVIGKRIDLGFMYFGPNWQPLGPVHWPAMYYAGPLSMRVQRTQDPKQPVIRTLSLSAGSIFTSRLRPSYAYWTAADQRARDPSDRFCDLAGQYTMQFNIPWPIYS